MRYLLFSFTLLFKTQSANTLTLQLFISKNNRKLVCLWSVLLCGLLNCFAYYFCGKFGFALILFCSPRLNLMNRLSNHQKWYEIAIETNKFKLINSDTKWTFVSKYLTHLHNSHISWMNRDFKAFLMTTVNKLSIN